MKFSITVGLLLLAVSSSASALTARQYYDAFLSKHNFHHYSGMYVCFPEQDVGGFSVLAKTEATRYELIKVSGITTQPQAGLNDYLVELVYTQGKVSEHNLYRKANHNSNDIWFMQHTLQYQGKSVYRIDWSTGHYSLHIYANGRKNNLPSYVEKGVCEQIHPLATR